MVLTFKLQELLGDLTPTLDMGGWK